MLLVGLIVKLTYSPYPASVQEMHSYIERLPTELKNHKLPETPGSYSPVAMDRRRDFTELFSPMEEDFYLQTIIDEKDDYNNNELKGVAVLRRVGMGQWEYVFPIYINEKVRWKYQPPAPDPYEYRHIKMKSSPGAICDCPDCTEARSRR